MSDTKKRMGKSIIGTVLPQIPNELETNSPFFQRTPPGTGMDERTPMILSDDMQALESEKISKIFKSFRQKSLMTMLEGSALGSVEKLNRITLAASVQSFLPESFIPGASKTSSITAGGLLDDWNASIEF